MTDHGNKILGMELSEKEIENYLEQVLGRRDTGQDPYLYDRFRTIYSPPWSVFHRL